MAEERATITKECALIRTAFKDEKSNLRHRNVAKLLFVHMLGYPSHFGQMECLKLISGTRFSEKRIGYLGLMLLMSENEETLMLVTNSVKNDIIDKNQYTVGLALTAIGNIASEDMCRDLFPEVDKAMRNSNTFIRKKAALACVRVLEKVPDLIEDCVDVISSLMSDRNHAVLLTGATLLQNAMRIDPTMIDTFRQLVPNLVRILKNLVVNNFSPEHDVGGITDPFLQVTILEILRVLGKDDEDASDEMNDVLAQVATNTESNKNAGNAILYACVSTIMEIESESGLKVMAINILGRFLLSKDNNTRYIALTMLGQVVKSDMAAVQRHRGTIVDCLKDPDVSIRRRALELLYALVNKGNIRALAREMLNYLIVADNEVKADLCKRTAHVVNLFSPDRAWHIDTMISMLQLAGNFCSDDIISQTISLIGKEENLRGYGVTKLYKSMEQDTSQIGLNHVSIWCIGEYGHLIDLSDKGKSAVEMEDEVVALLKKSLNLHNATLLTRSYVLSAALKLTVRFQSGPALSALQKIVATYSQSMNTELQARSCEYSNLLKPELASIRPNALKAMPVPERSEAAEKRSRLESVESDGARGKAPGAAANSGGDLLDLADIFGGGGGSNAGTEQQQSNNSGGGDNLLDDIFGGGSAPPAPQASNGAGDIMGLFGGSSAPAQPSFPEMTAFEKHGLKINFSFSKPGSPDTTEILATFGNGSGQPITGLSFQVAVPKFLKLSIQPASSNSVAPGGSATQSLAIANSQHGSKGLAMKCKISFSVGGQNITEMATITKFPAALSK
jgi:AP-1 complex subunit gamma-1